MIKNCIGKSNWIACRVQKEQNMKNNENSLSCEKSRRKMAICWTWIFQVVEKIKEGTCSETTEGYYFDSGQLSHFGTFNSQRVKFPTIDWPVWNVVEINFEIFFDNYDLLGCSSNKTCRIKHYLDNFLIFRHIFGSFYMMNKSTLFRFALEDKEKKIQKEKIFNRRSQRLSFFSQREKLSRKINPEKKIPLPQLIAKKQPAKNVRIQVLQTQWDSITTINPLVGNTSNYSVVNQAI